MREFHAKFVECKSESVMRALVPPERNLCKFLNHHASFKERMDDLGVILADVHSAMATKYLPDKATLAFLLKDFKEVSGQLDTLSQWLQSLYHILFTLYCCELYGDV